MNVLKNNKKTKQIQQNIPSVSTTDHAAQPSYFQSHLKLFPLCTEASFKSITGYSCLSSVAFIKHSLCLETTTPPFSNVHMHTPKQLGSQLKVTFWERCSLITLQSKVDSSGSLWGTLIYFFIVCYISLWLFKVCSPTSTNQFSLGAPSIKWMLCKYLLNKSTIEWLSAHSLSPLTLLLISVAICF